MSFKRLEADDFVISADSISATLWSNNSPTLNNFFTSSVQALGSSGNYYLNVFVTSSNTASSEFAIAYGNSAGSGSANYNNLVNGKSPSSTIYGQYQNLVLGDENIDFVFGNITSSEFFALSIDRARYKEKILLGSLTLSISGSSGFVTLTDNSAYVSSTIFNEAGRVYQLISGSSGVRNSSLDINGYTSASGSYGWLLPDIGTILLNPKALSATGTSGGIGFLYSGSAPATGTINTSPNFSLFRAISGSGAFKLNSEETITSDYIFVRPRSSEFNYSENPLFISGSTGEVLYPEFINSPQVYITTVGLYNDNNELLAVAKLSRPLVKDFTKEALVRVKLDF